MHRPLAVIVLTASLALSSPPLASAGNSFRETDLISDLAGRAAHLDSAVVNPWGIVVTGRGEFRISDNGTGLSTAYSRTGVAVGARFAIPPAGEGNPTGLVVNDQSGFILSSAGKSARSRFIMASEDGSISAWSPELDAGNAIQVASTADAIYKGLALGRSEDKAYLFAANFHAGTVDVFDSHFAPVTWSGAFSDPDLPEGYAPYNIANLGGKLYVAYAKQDGDRHDDVPGAGFGFLDVFSTSGQLLHRVVSGGALNAPWGMTLAPKHFGPFGRALIVGNFGDGVINAFDVSTGGFLGHLEDSTGAAISIEGLWGLAFARASEVGKGEKEESEEKEENEELKGPATLYFTAGIEDESHGLVGTLRATEELADDEGGDDDGHGDDQGDDDHGEHDSGQHGHHHREALRVSALLAHPMRLSNASTMQFKVTSDVPATVRLRIYDAMGRLVAEPLRDVAVNGTVIAPWDGYSVHGVKVRGGTYFFHAVGGPNVASGRVIVVP